MTTSGAFWLVLMALAPATTVEAPPAAPGVARPPAAIVADAVTAVGGDKALRRHKTLYTKRTLVVKSMGITGSEERWLTSAGQLSSVATISGLGTFRTGSTGPGKKGVRWTQDPINGLRVLKGAEDEAIRIEATWAPELELAKLYKEIRPAPAPADAPVSPEGGLECLDLVPKVGNPMLVCLDARTHLRVFQRGRQVTPQGEVPFSAIVKEWREVDGVKLPAVEELTAGPLTFEQRLEEAAFDRRPPARAFAMPRPGAAPGGAP